MLTQILATRRPEMITRSCWLQ